MDQSSSDQSYVVIARQYRPGNFTDLVGQDQVAKALSNAIDKNRVGHAYLFTGARGVGKTSTARIFAKCLNCQSGPTGNPCGSCDICQSIAAGDDVDVLEIDGASNRGIEEIRQLRANVNVRPSRSRFKIYIIDEVHMLTMQAFNALLKTLEEPPKHVKFFFCTTDPEKIPITVLSRCQRFDLPPISIEQIKQRLQQISESEGVSFEEEAIEILARRANGSMRDSQSLLDQLFSFCGERLTVSDVHNLLGTADSSQVLAILVAIMEGETARGLRLAAEAIDGGVDSGQLTEQLLSLFRDMMTLRVGCDESDVLFCNSSDLPRLKTIAEQTGLEHILAAIEIFDNTLTRMRYSTYTRTLLEAAIVRISKLPDLQLVADLVQQVTSGETASATTRPRVTKQQPADSSVKKKEIDNSASQVVSAPIDASSAQAGLPEGEQREVPSTVEISDANCEQIWNTALAQLGDMTSDVAGNYQSFSLQGDHLVVTMIDSYHRDACQRVERKQRLENILEKITRKKLRIDFEAAENAKPHSQPRPPAPSRIQKIRQIERDPLVKQAIELFDAEVTEVIEAKKK